MPRASSSLSISDKGKVILCLIKYAMKMYGGVDSAFLNFTLDGAKRSFSRLCRFTAKDRRGS
jgi:hypothetical protein